MSNAKSQPATGAAEARTARMDREKAAVLPWGDLAPLLERIA